MVEIAFAEPQDRTEVAAFMEASFPRAKWGADGWRALLDGRWARAGDPFAVTARDGARLLGVLGLVTARRHGGWISSNMTSWYVEKSLRGQGVGSAMLELATADPALTVTNFSSARAAVPVVERAGFSVLDALRCIWRPSGASGLPTEPLRPETLPAETRRVLADHAGLRLRPVAVRTSDGICALLIAEQQKHDAYVTHEVMHLSDPARFARHARGIADAVLPKDGAVLSVDSRFVIEGANPDAVEDIPIARFFKGPQTPARVDALYSEIVLLNMKLY